jgi:hypothetical protein
MESVPLEFVCGSLTQSSYTRNLPPHPYTGTLCLVGCLEALGATACGPSPGGLAPQI